MDTRIQNGRERWTGGDKEWEGEEEEGRRDKKGRSDARESKTILKYSKSNSSSFY